MRRAGLYLNGQRFEVTHLAVEFEVCRRRRRRVFVPGLPDLKLTGRVFVPPRCNLSKLFRDPVRPVTLRYRNLSGPFYIDAVIGEALTFTAMPAGPITVKP